MAQLLHQILADSQIKRKTRILIGTVDGLSHIQMNLRTILDQDLCHHGAAIGLIQFLKKILRYGFILYIPPQKLQHTVQRKDAFCHQIYPVHIGNGRNLRIHIVQRYIQLPVQNP